MQLGTRMVDTKLKKSRGQILLGCTLKDSPGTTIKHNP